jgi:cobalamin biosynthesis protein CobD/CbiB
MPFDPIALLLAIPLELLVIASVIRWRALHQRLARLYERLDKPERGRGTLKARGAVLVAAALVAGAVIGFALQTIAERSSFPLAVTAVALGLTLRSGVGARVIFAAAVDSDFQTNRQRAALVARGLVDGLIAPALYYLLGGLTAAMAYRAVAMMAEAAGDRLSIAWAPRRVRDLLLLVPGIIGAILVVIAAVFVPRGNPLDALRFALMPGRAASGVAAGRTVAAATGALGIVVEGNGGWLGPANGRARIDVTDIIRVGMLCGAAGAVLLAGLIVLVVVEL